jgi:hypothetical protein
MSHNDETQILREAAKAASSLLPQLEEQRANLDQRINALRAMLTAWEALSGKSIESQAPPARSSTQSTSTRVPKGEVSDRIDQILVDGQSYDAPQLRNLIAQRFESEYNRATIYAALRRGTLSGRYERDGNGWRMKTEETTPSVEENDGPKDERHVNNGQIVHMPSFFAAGVAEQA